jgi:tetratricopeptide (TPR) repeat protein
VWLDLGRAQEAGAYLVDARESYERAVANDRGYAAAQLRLGIIAAAQARRDQSQAAYAEAERLYKAASRPEGQVEVLIRRGSLLDTLGEFREARTTLEQAIKLAATIDGVSQMVRAQMRLSSVTSSEGHLAQAERLASEAVDRALGAGLETIAADGLVDLAATLIYLSKPAEAEQALRRARELAEKRDARRTIARASLQLASLQADNSQYALALATLGPPLEFFKQRHFRRYELTALSIAARAHQQLDDLSRAYALSSELLAIAESTKSDVEVALALGNLATNATALGSLPEALTLRERAEQIHQRQNDRASRPYDLTNRAELLIRLGRFDAAAAALNEVESGIAQRLDGYAGRQRRVTFLRTLEALVTRRYTDAARLASSITPQPTSSDSASVLGPSLENYARARLTSEWTTLSETPQAAVPPALWRERQYWRAASALAANRFNEAVSFAREGLTANARVGNDELEWRLAAIGSVAAGRLKSADEQRALHERGVNARARLRSRWGPLATEYENRPDLVELRRAAGL